MWWFAVLIVRCMVSDLEWQNFTNQGARKFVSFVRFMVTKSSTPILIQVSVFLEDDGSEASRRWKPMPRQCELAQRQG